VIRDAARDVMAAYLALEDAPKVKLAPVQECCQLRHLAGDPCPTVRVLAPGAEGQDPTGSMSWGNRTGRGLEASRARGLKAATEARRASRTPKVARERASGLRRRARGPSTAYP
jgi:hypothetical protein